MARKSANIPFVLLPLLFLLSAVPARAEDRPGKLTLDPDHLSIGILYGGHDIRLKAVIPEGHEAVVRVTGPGEPLEFKKKGKKLGFLWMNEGEIQYKTVPSLFLIHSSRSLAELAPAATLENLRIGYDALHTGVTSDSGAVAGALFGDVIKLKEKDGLFCCKEGGVSILPQTKGYQEVSSHFVLPAKTPVGVYTVDLFGFSGGKGLLLASGKVFLDRGPIISFITSMAAKHGLLYGCLAVGIALIAGLLTGFIFGLGRGGAH